MYLKLLYSIKRRWVFIVYAISFLLLGSIFSAEAQSITSFSPTTICQGETVTITGAGFTGATAVKLGNLSAAGFTVKDDNTITATVANLAATGTVTVTTPAGLATASGNLTIIQAPIPALTHIGAVDPFTNCDGNATYQMNVSNSTTNTTGNNTYKIDWGDNTTPFTQSNWSTGAQISHTYTSQGYFNITLTVTPDNGCAKTIVYPFYNGQNPLASFTTTASTTGLCAPAAVQFQIGNWFNNSAGTSYQVNFGDGTPIVTLTHPLNPGKTVYLLSHIYTTTSCPNAVDFTATLKAVNGCFTTTYTLNQIIIRKKPVADFSFTPVPACLTTPVCFTNNTISGFSGNSCVATTNFTWDFGDGTSSTSSSPPCHTYAAAGTYNVMLSASNQACGSDVITKQVTVIPTSPVPVAASPVFYCRGQQAVPLTATGTGLLWYTSSSGGTGNPVAPTPSTANAGSVTFYVSQTLPNNCESPRIPVVVTVNAPPGAPAVASPLQLCKDQAPNPLTATGTGLLWYSASSGGTGSSTPPTPSTSAIGNTTYYVSQTTNTCEGPRAAIVIIVNALATAPAVVSPVIYCQNQPSSPLTATGSGLLWYTDPVSGTGSATAPVPSTSAVGSTDYYVSQVTGCGEGPRAVITVTVNARPSAAIAYATTNLCNVLNTPGTPNLPVPVTLTGTPGGVYTTAPASGLKINAATGELDPSGATAGSYVINYTIKGTGGCSDFITSANVIVSGTPSAAISYGSPFCTSTPAASVQITGTKGGAFTSTTGLTIDAATGAITPATSIPGTYTVTYTITPSAPCPGFTATTSVTVTQAPSASISYSTVNLCNVKDDPSTPNSPVPVTLTGASGGTFSIIPATGLSVDPATGTLTPSGSIPGSYTINYTIKGSGGCPDLVRSANVTVSGAPTATISYPGSPYCHGIITAQPVLFTGTSGGVYSSTAGLSINASTGAINPSLSLPGTYQVVYTIAASSPCPGFVATTSVQIDESPVITFPVPVQAICSGGTANYTPSSTVVNTTYTWSVQGALPANVTGITSGTASGTNPVISLSFRNTGTIGRSLTIQVVPTNPSQNPCPGAPYNLTLVVNPIPPAPVTDTADFCMTAPSMVLSVQPLAGNTINWYDDNMNLLNAAPVVNTAFPAMFRYFVSQSNSSNCEGPKSEIVAVVHPVAKIVSSSFTNPTKCGVPSGSIVLNVLDLNNNPIPNIPVIVHYDKFQTSLTANLSTDASGKINMLLTAGSYSGIYVETSGGCVSQKIPDIFVLKDPTPPAQPVAGYNPPICSETPLILTALSPTSTQGGPIDYVWAGAAFGPLPDSVNNTVITFPSASMSYAGTYVVYAIQNNCISLSADFQVVIKQSPAKPTIATRSPLCIGEDLTLQAYSSIPGNATLNFLWTGPGTGFPVSASNAGISKVKLTDAGVYSVTVNSPQTGCSVTADTLILIGGYPVVKFAQDTLTFPTGYRLNLLPVITNASVPGILPIKNYVWSPTQDLTCNDASCSSPLLTVKNNVCYSVKAINFAGCSGSDTLCVRVFCQNSQVFIPNAFTPRGNVPENSKLIVRATGVATVKAFRVFNRWGKIVFERSNFSPNSPEFGWDGMVNGKLADVGVYVYTVDVICENGVPYSYKGNVTLL